jgi:hypothetical protein
MFFTLLKEIIAENVFLMERHVEVLLRVLGWEWHWSFGVFFDVGSLLGDNWLLFLDFLVGLLDSFVLFFEFIRQLVDNLFLTIQFTVLLWQLAENILLEVIHLFLPILLIVINFIVLSVFLDPVRLFLLVF